MASAEVITADTSSPAHPGCVVRLEGPFTSRELAGVSKYVDNTAAVIAGPELIGRLRRLRLRVPTFPVDHDPAEIAAAVSSFSLEAPPDVVDGVLRAGRSRRLHAKTGPADTDDEEGGVKRALDRLEGAHAVYGHAHARRFIQTLERTRRPSDHGSTLLELSSFPVITAVANDWGYWCAATIRNGGPALAGPSNPFDAGFGRKVELNVDIESQRLRADDEIFDVVLALEIIEHLPRDPMQLLVEANRVLRQGGQLIVSTPNIVGERALGLALAGEHPANYYFFERSGSLDRHHFEWTPDLLAAALRASGFYIDELATHYSWWDPDPELGRTLDALGHPRHLRGDNIIATATKVTPLVRRMPDELYTGEVDKPEWLISTTAEPRVAP